MKESDRKEIDGALARFLDGEAEPGDGERLAEAMRTDEAFDDEVRRLLVLDDFVRQNASLDGRSFEEAFAWHVAALHDKDSFFDRIERRLPGSKSPARLVRSVPWLIGAAAVIAASLGVNLYFRAAPRERATVPMEVAGGGRTTATASRPPSTRPLPKTAIATLVDEAGAEFTDSPAPRAMRFDAGTYRQVRGIVHLRFASGADVVIRAPASFAIHDPLRMTLTEGAVRAIVPDSAHGFTIEAPGVEYEDLGTEFCVAVPAGRAESELYVSDGRVDLKSPAGERIAQVTLGESVRVVGGTVEPEKSSDLDRVPTPGAVGLQRWNRWRETFQNDPSLLCYYPFIAEPSDDRRLRDEATHGKSITGRIRGARWVSGRWPGKQALLFDHDEDAVELNIPGEYRALTMAAWVNIDRLDYAINAILDSDGWEPGDVHWQLRRSGEVFAGYRELQPERRPRQTYGVVGSAVPLGRWVHLAAVLDLDRAVARVFLDGEPFGEMAPPDLPPKLGLIPGRCLMGNWVRREDWPNDPKRGLRGRIDEFAVWQRALTHEELHAIATAGRPSFLNAAAGGSPGP